MHFNVSRLRYRPTFVPQSDIAHFNKHCSKVLSCCIFDFRATLQNRDNLHTTSNKIIFTKTDCKQHHVVTFQTIFHNVCSTGS